MAKIILAPYGDFIDFGAEKTIHGIALYNLSISNTLGAWTERAKPDLKVRLKTLDQIYLECKATNFLPKHAGPTINAMQYIVNNQFYHSQQSPVFYALYHEWKKMWYIFSCSEIRKAIVKIMYVPEFDEGIPHLVNQDTIGFIKDYIPEKEPKEVKPSPDPKASDYTYLILDISKIKLDDYWMKIFNSTPLLT